MTTPYPLQWGALPAEHHADYTDAQPLMQIGPLPSGPTLGAS